MSRIFSCQWKHPEWSDPLSNSSVRHIFCKITHQVGLKLGGRIQCRIPLNPHPVSPHSDFTEARTFKYTDGLFSGCNQTHVAYITKEVNRSVAKRLLNFSGGLAKVELTSLVK